MTSWFTIQKASPERVDLYINDMIGDWIDGYYGFGVTAASLIAELKALPETVTAIRVLINSPGGDVYSGLTIANELRRQHAEMGRAVETSVIGIAASSASLILMAGQVISVADNAIVMIHNPWSIAMGGAREFRQAADRLETIRDAALATYRWHSTKSKAELSTMMDDETYLSADEAIAAGLATRKVGGKIEKRFPGSVIAALKLPARFAEIAKALTQPRQTFTIAKADPVKKQCFGWASMALTADGLEIVDGHQHIIEPGELEQAAYHFNLHHRDMDEDHSEPVVGALIESMVVTPDKLEAMGLASNALPQGWWVGFQVTDDAVFAKVVSGKYRMFSIAGTAALEEVQ